MFDIGFSELMLISIVALVVIGPERLPKVARTAGQWLGRLNRYVSQVKQDIDRDIKLEELRNMQKEMKDTAQKYEIMAGDTRREVETVVEQETGQISRVMQAMSATDGGLTMQEWDKVKSEETAAAALAMPVLATEQKVDQKVAISAPEQTANSLSQPIAAVPSVAPVSRNDASEKVVG
jgi:sec-independent protein translocase protein TatB